MNETWRRWQDWASVVLGVLLFITPFVFGATAVTAAAYTAYIGGVLLVIAGLIDLATPTARYTEWAEVVLGVLIFISPFVLGFTAVTSMAWSAYIVGILAVVFSGWVLYGEGRGSRLAAQH